MVTTRRGELGDDVLRVQRTSAGLLARRGDDQVLLSFPASVGERLIVSSGLVRARRLLDERAASLTALTLVRGSVRERVDIATDGSARVVTPVSTLADPGGVTDLPARLAGLEAVRFVADEPLRGYVFWSP